MSSLNTNQPWECPRCKRINAPFNPCCFCQPPSGSARAVIDKLKNPSISFESLDKYTQNSRCLSCGGHHGIFAGQAIQCMKLEARA